jgi:mannose-6-phosphate isomerase-like protein (cupin superfamily)
MKPLLLAALLTVIAVPAFAQAPSPPPQMLYASAADVEAAMARAKAAHKGDDTNTIEVIARVGTYPVQLEYRTGATPPSVHTGQAELLYITDGGATFVMGGTLVNPKAGNGGNLSGTGVDGGATRKLAKGDFVLVPAGTPHWITGVDGGRLVMITLHMPQTPLNGASAQ